MSEQALPIVINSHKVNPANDRVTVLCIDGQGAGGAHHHYAVLLPVHDLETLSVRMRREWFLPGVSGPVLTEHAGPGGTPIVHFAQPAVMEERLVGYNKAATGTDLFENFPDDYIRVDHYSNGEIEILVKDGGDDECSYKGSPGSFVFGFQNGPIKEEGVNGATQEVLMAIIEHRLESFQAGPFSCRENALALTKLQESKMWLFDRTLKRMQRGVEGTHKK